MVANDYYIVTKWREEFRFCASDFTVGNLDRPWCQLETRIASHFDKLSGILKKFYRFPPVH